MDISDPKARAIIEAALADRLLEILEEVEPAADVEAAWSAEIERRLDEVRGGKVAFVDGDEVLEQMRRIVEE